MTDTINVPRKLLERIIGKMNIVWQKTDETEELRTLLQAPSAPATVQGDGWIPVGERLPEYGQEVIVNSNFDGVCAGVLDSYDEWFAPCSEYKLTRITHWMPLPAAPGAAPSAPAAKGDK